MCACGKNPAMKNSVLIAFAVLAFAPCVAHAQAVGGFVRRSTGPVSPQPSMPVQTPQQSTSAPVYTTPTQNTTTTYSPPVQIVRPLPSPIPSTQGYSNAPSYNMPSYNGNSQAPNSLYRRRVTGSGYSNGPVYSNAPIYAPSQNGNAPVYGSAPANSNAPVYGSSDRSGRRLRVTTPTGPRYLQPPTVIGRVYTYPTYNNAPVYGPAPGYGAPGYGGSNTTLLGGYYYGNYCDTYVSGAYPSVYGFYLGFPQYILTPGVTVTTITPYPIYVTPYLPFDAPSYPVTYNENNYYVSSPERVQEVQAGGDEARAVVRHAAAEGSYQAAFGDIEQAWSTGNVGLLRKHVRDEDTKVSVFLKNKYAYSLASGDLVQITRDAFDRLDTVSFQFDHLRKAKNGDVTAYGKHVYRLRDGGDGATAGGDAVPFTTDGGAGDSSTSDIADADKTVYVSYTLRHGGGVWYIVGVNSSPTPVVKQ